MTSSRQTRLPSHSVLGCIRSVSQAARERSLGKLPCQYCYEPILLQDKLEQELTSEKKAI